VTDDDDDDDNDMLLARTYYIYLHYDFNLLDGDGTQHVFR